MYRWNRLSRWIVIWNTCKKIWRSLETHLLPPWLQTEAFFWGYWLDRKVLHFCTQIDAALNNLKFGTNCVDSKCFMAWNLFRYRLAFEFKLIWSVCNHKNDSFQSLKLNFNFLWILKTGVPSAKNSPKFNRANERLKIWGIYCQDMCLIRPKINMSTMHRLYNYGWSKCPSLTFSREYRRAEGQWRYAVWASECLLLGPSHTEHPQWSC